MKEIEILTERTRLRLIDLSDLTFIHNLHSFPETDRFNTLGIPENIKETKSIIELWIANNRSIDRMNYTFAIESKLDKEFIGLFGLKLSDKKHRRGEVWCKFIPEHWNKGFATEVVAEVIDFGFEKLNLHRIEAGCAVDNIGSIKVLEKVGMIREGRGRQLLPLNSGWSDNFQYSILESDNRKP